MVADQGAEEELTEDESGGCRGDRRQGPKTRRDRGLPLGAGEDRQRDGQAEEDLPEAGVRHRNGER